MVPLTLHCLGVYKNGIWLTISSLLVWIDNLDIGLGNGLRNYLAECIAKDDNEGARQAVSSTFVMLIVIIVPVCLLLCLVVYNVDLYGFLNVDSRIVPNLMSIIVICLIFVCSTFIFKFIGNVYLGLQLPAVNNMLQALGQTLALLFTVLIYQSDYNSLLLIAVANTAAPLIAYLLSYPYTFYIRYKSLRPSLAFVKKSVLKKLLSTGMMFFAIQISGVLLFMSSNILISHLFSPYFVTPYQVAYRYFYIPLLLFMIVCTPYWSATTDAYSRNDMAWIRESNSKLNRFVVIISVVIVLMILISNPFYSLWVGNDIDIPVSVTVMMAFYILITATSLRYSLVLNGLGALRLQLIITVSVALSFVPLAIVAAKLTGSLAGFLSVLCLVNIPGLIINKIQFNRIINKTARGIWRA